MPLVVRKTSRSIHRDGISHVFVGDRFKEFPFPFLLFATCARALPCLIADVNAVVCSLPLTSLLLLLNK